jgi:peptide methionine sulfoxide reductase msrA/msrB
MEQAIFAAGCFWGVQYYFDPDIGDSYRSAIFYVTDDQKDIAEKVRNELQPEHDDKIVTEITEAGPFYEAEDYHQKFTERTGRGMCHVPYAPIG